MRIVVFAGNSGSGGLKGYIRGFMTGCRAREEEVYVICTPSAAEEVLYNSIGDNINIIPMEESAMGFWQILFGNRLSKTVRDRIDEISPDIVLFTNSIIHRGTEKYVNALGFHNQLYVDNVQLSRMVFTKAWLTLLLHKHKVLWSLENADICVFDSHQSYLQVKDYGLKISNPIIAYFGVDATERAERSRISCVLHSPIRLLYISSLFAYKNQVELIYAIDMLRSYGYAVHLDLVGSGDPRYIEKVKDCIHSRHLDSNVTLHSWVNHKSIKHMIDECDVFLYASSIETSGFGLMEGMARGIPIACNNESCMPEVLHDGGILFDVHSPEDTARKVQSLIDNASLRNELAEKALCISREYTWENNVNRVFSGFKKYLGRV